MKKKTVRKIRKAPHTVRGMLNLIEEFLMPRRRKASQLWDVLTALRGPDIDGGGKAEATLPIRRAAFPKLADVVKGNGPGQIRAVFSGSSVFRIVSHPSSHFLKHGLRAAKVLNLLPVI